MSSVGWRQKSLRSDKSLMLLRADLSLLVVPFKSGSLNEGGSYRMVNICQIYEYSLVI